MPRPLRTLFLHYGGDWKRGTETVLLAMMERLDREHITPVVACNQERIAEAVRRLDVPAYVVDRPRVMLAGRRSQFQVLRWLRTVAHVGRLVREQGVAGIVCMNGQPSQVAYYAAHLHGLPCLSYLHSFYDRRFVYLYRLNRVPHLIFCSAAIRSSIRSKAALRGESYVVHNGVDTEFYTPAKADERAESTLRRSLNSPDRVVIGQVGSLIHRKGIDVLLKAAKQLLDEGKPIHIALVGSGPDESSYRRMAHELGIADVVTFHGDVGDPRRFYRELFDIHVLASREEAFGLTLLEASSCGLPNVGARTGGIPEVISEGFSGFTFESENPADLAEKLRTLIDRKATRHTMGANARELATARFSLRNQIAGVEEVILRAVGRSDADLARDHPTIRPI
ncbi:MAG: glycosyltransferase family 4 protein [Chloroflexota bacterium]